MPRALEEEKIHGLISPEETSVKMMLQLSGKLLPKEPLSDHKRKYKEELPEKFREGQEVPFPLLPTYLPCHKQLRLSYHDSTRLRSKYKSLTKRIKNDRLAGTNERK